LHPTEAYLINTESDLLKPGVYHYVSHDHALEKRCEFSLDNHQKPASIFVALSSIHWREAWKYGERAFRYCQHDIGHALGSLRYAAAVLGWSLELMAECGDDELGKLLGLNRHDDFIHHENEAPDLLCRIRCKPDDNLKASFDSLLSQARDGLWSGQAEKLSVYHQNHWPIIDEVAIATHKPHTEEPAQSENWQINPSHWSEKSATAMIQQRRSAQRFDAMSFLPQADFIRLLGSVMPTNQIPFDVWRWPPRIHLLLFVHRVENVKPGLYLLPRDNAVIPKLRAAMTDQFEWQPIELEVESLPLFRLVVANCQRAAKTLSCHQDIASDGAFSLAMLAEFQQSVSAAPWQYRHLFWETGLIGQSLYLEAEAVGMRGTGIGCFFDDSVHETLGLKNNNFQSLYHFTVGKPLEDSRLQTLPAYAHLGRNFPG
jgi:nitroreductase